MTVIDELLNPATNTVEHLPAMNPDPLADISSLQEAQIVDVRVRTLTGTVGLLFDLRQSLQYPDTDTGVLICSGVTGFAWDAPARETSLTAWSVGRAAAQTEGGALSVQFDLWPAPGATLALVCQRAVFVSGRVEGLDAVAPSYDRLSPAAAIPGVASWTSVFQPMARSHRGVSTLTVPI